MAYIGTKPQIATTLADNIVTADKIASGAVTDPKIAAMAATKLTGVVPDANAPSGSVIQVVQAYKTNIYTKSGATWSDVTGLSAAITPVSSTSRILINLTINGGIAGQGAITRMRRTIGGSSSYVGQPDFVSGTNQSIMATVYDDGDTNDSKNLSWSFLDTPNTASTISYQLEINCIQGGTVVIGEMTSQLRNQSYSHVTPCSLTLWEIAG